MVVDLDLPMLADLPQPKQLHASVTDGHKKLADARVVAEEETDRVAAALAAATRVYAQIILLFLLFHR